jgi:low affinity Fe/Cu permease
MKRTIDDRFTAVADTVSEAVGKWWITGGSVIAVAIWLATGPFFHWSDTWQLLINTPTTILEMWLGFLCCAAANRVEKRNWQLHQTMKLMLDHIAALSEKEEHEITDDLKKALIRQDKKLDALLSTRRH